ncbi:MAG: SDR family oxidoreductase [Gemmatimonadetes bacterium]|nr:SDR family oxidoreductase [Gemmatimonadota bacterium]
MPAADSDSIRLVALVTGATAGIGRVFAQRLAASGHDLILVARDSVRLAAFADELALQYGVNAEALSADLSRDDDMRRVADRIARESRLTVLVNNAGFGSKGKLVNRPVAEQATMVELHVMAPMVHSRAALPGMIERRRGWIINVTSVASFTYSAGNVNYCATKAFLRAFSEALALEVADSGVRVQALCPGFTRTEFHDRAGMDTSTIPRWLWLDAGRVVDDSLAQIAAGGPVVCVPSKRFKLIVLLLRFVPQWMQRPLRSRYGKSRT